MPSLSESVRLVTKMVTEAKRTNWAGERDAETYADKSGEVQHVCLFNEKHFHHAEALKKKFGGDTEKKPGGYMNYSPPDGHKHNDAIHKHLHDAGLKVITHRASDESVGEGDMTAAQHKKMMVDLPKHAAAAASHDSILRSVLAKRAAAMRVKSKPVSEEELPKHHVKIVPKEGTEHKDVLAQAKKHGATATWVHNDYPGHKDGRIAVASFKRKGAALQFGGEMKRAGHAVAHKTDA